MNDGRGGVTCRFHRYHLFAVFFVFLPLLITICLTLPLKLFSSYIYPFESLNATTFPPKAVAFCVAYIATLPEPDITTVLLLIESLNKEQSSLIIKLLTLIQLILNSYMIVLIFDDNLSHVFLNSSLTSPYFHL